MITPTQCKAARALLRWNHHKMAKAANISSSTLAQFERGRTLIPNNMKALELAFRTAGIRFIGLIGVVGPPSGTNAERAKLRPSNFNSMTADQQWEIDKGLGLLDWDGKE